MTQPPPSRRRRLAKAALAWLLLIAIATFAITAGLKIRRWTWDITTPIHFGYDINRGYGWGVAASGPLGYLNTYDKMAGEEPGWHIFLDYAPLRLAVMTLWARHNRATQTPFDNWRTDYAFNAPVLWFNTAMELIGVVAAFLIVRRVAIQAERAPAPINWAGEWWLRLRRRPLPPMEAAPPHRPFTGWVPATIAALLLWFNPTMMVSAYGWPTWDMWVVPMYLLAVLAAVYDAWLLCGVALAIGVMFKGQQLVGAPVFLAWTLLQGRWSAAARYGCGFVIGMTAVAAPWLLTRVPNATLADWYLNHPQSPNAFNVPPFVAVRDWNWPAIAWVCGVFAVSAAAPQLGRFWRRWMIGVWAAAVALVIWPIFVRHDAVAIAMIGGGAAAVFAIALLVRGRVNRAIFALTTTAAALLACIAFFGASSAWWTCGIAYGTSHYPYMIVGLSDNLPGLLDRRFDFHDIHAVLFTLPAWAGLPAMSVTMGQLLRGLFVLSLVPCLWAVARHARRRDRRLLVALVAPWLMFFCFPAQIHERYLLYAAAVGSILIGQSVGMTLLALVLTAFAWMQTIHVMLSFGGIPGRAQFGHLLHEWQPWWFDGSSGATLFRFLDHTFPDAAWAVLLAAAVFLYASVRSTPRCAPASQNLLDSGRHSAAPAVQPEIAPVAGAAKESSCIEGTI